MKVFSGKVVGGVIEVEGVQLQEGSTVTILAPEEPESFSVSEEDADELRRRAEAAERGETLTPDQLIERLRRGN
jgi:hypothetical protein